ncbi:MAG TPA: glycoside hydrolase family 2 TIM barrel-domain containing protein [Bacteroidales bacterium]|nr:glycoside hydrolase family 2 TIM barrel-domain containing protein [Bacteroidales bacterium]
MKLLKTIILLLLISTLSCKTNQDGREQSKMEPLKVELTEVDNHFQLLKNGDPYFIMGAGTTMDKIRELSENGANSCRTWSTETENYTADQFMDTAHYYNLTVTLGLDVQKERKGFDYNDSAAVKKQFEYIKNEVLKYKDHPALLVWGIGNELNLNYTNPKVWDAVNDIAKMIKEVDPNHPTTTMLAGIKEYDVVEIAKRCPDLDFLSIQMYGDLPNLQQRIRESGYDGPYVVSEWGATGHWEVASTAWGAPIEQTSKEKAESYIHRYRVAIESDSLRCLGSYVFFWGQKQERTPTWYGLFTEKGYPTETIDAMHFLWKEKWPENRAPQLDSLRLSGLSAFDNIKLEPSETYTAEVFYRNAEDEPLRYQWEILYESNDLGIGGDYESRPESIDGLIQNENTSKVEITAPKEKGAYRLFVYVMDSENKTATANIPFYVN